MRVVLFDGSGGEFPAVGPAVGRNEVELAVLSRDEVDRELPLDVTLGVALPKGDRQKWLVEKAVELGVTRIVPLRTQRAVAQPTEQALAGCGARWSRPRNNAAATACWRSTSRDPGPISSKRPPPRPCRLVAQPQGYHESGQFPLPEELPERVLLAVGPEGGFVGEEMALAIAAGWHTVDLGPRILRVETAALLLAAIVAQRWASGLRRL